MKSKEKWAIIAALSWGTVGLLFGLVNASFSWGEGGMDAFTIGQTALEMLLWCVCGALVGGGGVYAVGYVIERKLGLVEDDVPRLDPVLEKTNFIQGLLAETKKSYLGITDHVAAANQHLDAAEKEFAEGAFAPFWDEIERAANELAAYKNELEHLRRSVDVYKIEASDLEKISGPVPSLKMPDHRLPDARPSAARFSTIVRKAQTNFQFAVIYEQRKTNQLLHAGFGTLGAAIYSLGESIAVSLDTLSKSLNTKLDQLLKNTDNTSSITKALSRRQKEQTETLNGIQRGVDSGD